jgi:transposase
VNYLTFHCGASPFHIQRKFVNVHKCQGSAIAEEAIKRFANLYSIETEVWGQLPDVRVQVR